MVVATVADSAVRCAEGEAAAVVLSTAAVAEFGCLVHDLERADKTESATATLYERYADLIESWENVVCELHLGYGGATHRCVPDGEASDSLQTIE